MYCNIDDLKISVKEETLLELVNDIEYDESLNEEVVNENIVKADNIIEGYLRGKYITPFSPIPSIITDISVDIAVYFLYSRRPNDGVPEEVKEKYKDRLKMLKDMQEGKFLLDAIEIASSSEFGSGEYRTNKTTEDRIFSKDLLSRF